MKRKIIILIIVVLLVLLIPIPRHLKDGGTVEYKAFIYKISKVNTINEASPTGYDKGTIIELFGKIIYNSVEIYAEEGMLELEDVVDTDGLMFSIIQKDKDCTPVKLNVYSDGKYKLLTTYEACKPGSTCAMMLMYTKEETGSYNYDVLKILNHSKKVESYSSSYTPKYEIYTGKENQRYITGSNNEYLEDFLKSINIDLNKCAKKEYK